MIEFDLHTTIYRSSDISKVLALAVDDSMWVKGRRGVKYLNCPLSFDIETTSFYRSKDGETYNYEQYTRLGVKMEKCSMMYVWQFGINGYCIMGRTWKEYCDMVNAIVERLELNASRRVLVYVHNLAFEFQFIRSLFLWDKVFSVDARKPVYAITNGIEYRCSYLLSGYSLAKLGEHLTKYKCSKMVGDLDYQKLRHTQTPLTAKEIGYCVNDIKVVMCYIQEEIERNGCITNIPLTKTGYVRKYCRAHCLRYIDDETQQSKRNWKYANTIQSLKLDGLTEFNMLQRAFCGGFTHANAKYVGETLNDVDSYDFTSSYPAVMLTEKYPMSAGRIVPCVNTRQFKYLVDNYLCVFDVELFDVMTSDANENIISTSKCFIKEEATANNGRLVCARRVAMTVTSVDYKCIKQFYTWSDIKIGRMIVYKADYLPKSFIQSIIHLYKLKTTLKGVKGKEVEYLSSKEMLNSCYGMCVTNPLRDEYVYNNEEWDTRELTDKEKLEALDKYNRSKNRFLSYAWGVFVTAYARRNLYTGIKSCGNDYVYSDTDSVKTLKGDRHRAYFDTYNNAVRDKLHKMCNHYNIPFEDVEPRTIKGVSKLIGVWDYEGCYSRFKTLGAKRYLTEMDGEISMTVSGVNKKTAIPYLLKKYGNDGIWDAFTDYLDIPPTAAGKKIHTYVDYEQKGFITDYMGQTSAFETKSGVHLEPTGYTLNLSKIYLNYLMGIRFKR